MYVLDSQGKTLGTSLWDVFKDTPLRLEKSPGPSVILISMSVLFRCAATDIQINLVNLMAIKSFHVQSSKFHRFASMALSHSTQWEAIWFVRLGILPQREPQPHGCVPSKPSLKHLNMH